MYLQYEGKVGKIRKDSQIRNYRLLRVTEGIPGSQFKLHVQIKLQIGAAKTHKVRMSRADLQEQDWSQHFRVHTWYLAFLRISVAYLKPSPFTIPCLSAVVTGFLSLTLILIFESSITNFVFKHK